MSLRSIFAVVAALLVTFSSPPQSRAQTVKTGAELLFDQGFQPLKGKKFALVTNQEYGVWGGHDEEERRDLRRRWRRLGRPFPVMRTAPSDVVHRLPDTGPVHRAG